MAQYLSPISLTESWEASVRNATFALKQITTAIELSAKRWQDWNHQYNAPRCKNTSDTTASKSTE